MPVVCMSFPILLQCVCVVCDMQCETHTPCIHNAVSSVLFYCVFYNEIGWTKMTSVQFALLTSNEVKPPKAFLASEIYFFRFEPKADLANN